MAPTPSAVAEHACCHSSNTTDPRPGDPDGGVVQCCKAINGAPVPAKAEVKFDASKFQLQVFFPVEVLAPQGAMPALISLARDHGPPRSISFAESVLQRSLLSHAPPFSV